MVTWSPGTSRNCIPSLATSVRTKDDARICPAAARTDSAWAWGTGEPTSLYVTRYQDAAGRLLLSTVDPDARWRRPKPHKPVILGYKENLVVDKSGFLLARQVTPANAGDVEGAEPLLDGPPLTPRSLTGDAAYGTGAFRQRMRRQGITRYAPLKEPNQATASTLLATGAFAFHGDHLVCRAEQVLYPTGFRYAEGAQMFVAPPGACACARCGRRAFRPNRSGDSSASVATTTSSNAPSA